MSRSWISTDTRLHTCGAAGSAVCSAISPPDGFLGNDYVARLVTRVTVDPVQLLIFTETGPHLDQNDRRPSAALAELPPC